MLQTFAEYGPEMRRAGWAVLPSAGKSPIRKGFNTWKAAPGPDIVSRWAKQDPAADIVYVPGLCQRVGASGALSSLIPTTTRQSSRRKRFSAQRPARSAPAAAHIACSDRAGIDLGNLTSLRPLGSTSILKHGQRGAGIAAAPPSPHEKDRSFRYAWDSCDHTVIRDLPPFPIQALQKFLDKSPTPTRASGPGDEPRLRRDSRKLGINDFLISRVCFCADGTSFSTSPEHGTQTLAEHGYDTLEEDDFGPPRPRRVATAKRGRFVPMIGTKGFARTTGNEMDLLLNLNPKGCGRCSPAPGASSELNIRRDASEAKAFQFA